MQEHPVEHQDGVRGRLPGRRIDPFVGDIVEDGVVIGPRSAGTERVEQGVPEAGVVEGVQEEAVRGMPAQPVADDRRVMEVVDRGADDLPSAGVQHYGQGVGEGGLAGAVHAVDPHPGDAIQLQRQDRVGHAFDHRLGGGAAGCCRCVI